MEKNRNLDLTCEIDSYPVKNLEWILPDNTETSFQSEIITYSIQHQKLFIYNLRPVNSGKYTCCLKNNRSLCKSTDVYVQSKIIIKNQLSVLDNRHFVL